MFQLFEVYYPDLFLGFASRALHVILVHFHPTNLKSWQPHAGDLHKVTRPLPPAAGEHHLDVETMAAEVVAEIWASAPAASSDVYVHPLSTLSSRPLSQVLCRSQCMPQD